MELLLTGTGGPDGWPANGCGCASCARMRAVGRYRAPTGIRVDGRPVDVAARSDPRARRLPGGVAITAADGARVLCTAGHGLVPDVADDPGRYDVALLDPAADPYRLGALRRCGAVDDRTRIIAVHLDHRYRSPAEADRRFALWGVSAVADGTTVRTASLPVPSVAAHGRTLLLGGARSGKSAEAELRLAAEPAVGYLATGPRRDDDPEWRARVAAHRTRRPAWWTTVETIDLPPLLADSGAALLVDGIGTWLTAIMDGCGVWEARDGAEAAVAERIDELIAAWRGTRARVVAVTDEVGAGLVPATPGGRYFRDVLGRLNQRLADESETAAQVIAGRVLPLPD